MMKWEELVRKVEPYVPGEQPDQPDMIKLNTNENPYPPAPGVEQAIKRNRCGCTPPVSGSHNSRIDWGDCRILPCKSCAGLCRSGF